jgi:exopolysaccharide biosynthesis polyprenyl glycosylphosphotransferase
MSVTDRTPLLQSLQLQEELRTTVGDRTLQILERRRRTAIVKRRGWLVRRMLLVADVVGLVGALLMAQWLAPSVDNVDAYSPRMEIFAFMLTVPAWIVITKLYGLYDHDDERANHSTADDFGGVFHMVTVCTWIVIVVTYLSDIAHPSVQKLVVFWAAAIALVCLARASARTLARRNEAYVQNTVIVGAGDVGQLFAKKVRNHPEYGINLVGFVDAKAKERPSDLGDVALLGEAGRLPAIVRLLDVERVIVAFSNESHEETLELLRAVQDLQVQIDIVPRLFEFVGPGVEIHTVEGLPLFGLPPVKLSRSSVFVKRGFDLTGAVFGLALLLPLFVVVGVLIKLDSRGPIFYRHERVGRGGRPFLLFKFRTMQLEYCRGAEYGGEDADREFERLMADPRLRAEFEKSYKLKNDPRVTRLGNVLRKTSIDELPQLINVVLGHISLVGPRPLTAAEAERYGSDWDTVLSTRPGVTGYWQINGRSQLEYEDRVRLDLAYVSSWSLGLDLLILGKTLRVLLSRTGAA